MRKNIKAGLAAQPFQPFIVYTADGREFDGPTHDHARMSPSGGRVGIWSDDEIECILPALLISGLKVKSNGQIRRRAKGTNYFLETNRLPGSALGAGSRFGCAVNARAPIFGGGRSGKLYAKRRLS